MNLRRYTTAAPGGGPKPKSGTDPLVWIGIAGAIGAGFAYTFVLRKPDGAPAAVLSKPVPTISALDKDKFVDFKLKKVEPYNHNTSKYVSLEYL